VSDKPHTLVRGTLRAQENPSDFLFRKTSAFFLHPKVQNKPRLIKNQRFLSAIKDLAKSP